MLKEKEEFIKWWMLVIGLLFITFIIFGLLRYAGVFGERIIYKNSFQYREARESEISTYTAQLAEIERKLSNDLDTQIRANLEAQAAALRIHLQTAKNK